MAQKKVDINFAGVEDLERLAGIGRAKAEAIIDTRKRLGGFGGIPDLRKVPGIGQSVLDQNKATLACSPIPSTSSRRTSRRETRRSGGKVSTRQSTGSSVAQLETPKYRGDGSLNKGKTPLSRLTCERATRSSWESSNGSVKTVTPEASNYEESCEDRGLGMGVCESDQEGDDDEPFAGAAEDTLEGDVSSTEEEGEGVPDGADTPLADMEMDFSDQGSSVSSDWFPGGGSSHIALPSRIPIPIQRRRRTIGACLMKRKSDRTDMKGISPGKKMRRPAGSLSGYISHMAESSIKEMVEHHSLADACRRKIPSKENPPPGLANWLKTFHNWSNAERLMALDELITICLPTQVRHMMHIIEPQFQRDFISLLPKELALYVLSFLEPKDLLKAAQTCRYWRILAEDKLLWREKCREESIDEGLVYGYRPLRRSMTPGCSKANWKALYMRQHQIEQNWRTGELRPSKVLKGHDDHVITCLEFCGNRIVSGSDDNTLKVWSVTTGKCLRTLVGHTGGVWSSQMAGSNIISGSTDRTLKVWNAETGQCIHTLYGHTSTVRCMHLHNNKVVSGSRDATLRLWDIESGQCLHVLMGHVAAVRCVQYDGRRVVSGAYDYMVKVWDPETETCLHTLQGHTNRVYSLQFDGSHIVSGSLDTSIRVWDVESGNCLHTLIGHQSLTSGMELKDNILVSGNADSTVKVWDIRTGQCLQTLQGPNKHQSAVTCLQFNKRFVITSSDDGTVKIWDLKNGEFLRNLVSLDSGGSGGVVWRVRCCNTKLVCAVGSRNGTEETKLLVLDFDSEERKV
ncbi:F-box/WD repeat-containing protein 7-like isoform X2 [Liolophura sinensis]|uniref:F-box/WD repeat-containing protein 7-like isoform X2 n=1 Tax=Liolophura sinensis TaxID=3198878 RepID=UPI003158005F